VRLRRAPPAIVLGAVLAILLAALALIASPARAGGKPPFVFRGHPIGERPGAYADCANAKPDETGLLACEAAEPRNRWGVADIPRLGTVELAWLRYLFLDRKLVGIDARFDSADYAAVRELATARFGGPKQAVPGADTILVWDFAEGALRLTHWTFAATGDLSFMSNAAFLTITRRHAAAVKRRAQAAF
jgi:hypothetical protein